MSLLGTLIGIHIYIIFKRQTAPSLQQIIHVYTPSQQKYVKKKH